jgi:riboflavin kinase / FMN adenylyltransferase
MKVFDDPIHLPERMAYPVVAIGVFDGVHLGHQRILGEVAARAREMAGTAILLSFFPHPQKVISSGQAPPLLQTFDQQAEILAGAGIEIFLRFPFTRRLSLLSPADFVRDILLRLRPREVHVGENFRFGHRRAGDAEMLRHLGDRHGFAVYGYEAVLFRGIRVSSTRIRDLLSAGRVNLAGRLLGRPYEVRGSVVKGARKGVRLGFPTANLKVDNELIPATGVYATRALVNGGEFVGATNIGFRPTLRGYREPEPTVETHLLDFAGDIYGQPLWLRFCCRVRDERRFDALDALIDRIDRDILWIRRYWERVSTPRVDREKSGG